MSNYELISKNEMTLEESKKSIDDKNLELERQTYKERKLKAKKRREAKQQELQRILDEREVNTL